MQAGREGHSVDSDADSSTGSRLLALDYVTCSSGSGVVGKGFRSFRNPPDAHQQRVNAGPRRPLSCSSIRLVSLRFSLTTASSRRGLIRPPGINTFHRSRPLWAAPGTERRPRAARF